MHNLSIEQTPIAALKPHARNARTHSKRQIRQIANSIMRFGFTNPILTDDKQILAGHGRVETAKVLGKTTMPTIRLSHMTEAEKRAYVIADNAIALKASWDREILALEMQDLINLGFEIELTGFETAEIDLMLDEWQLASNDTSAPEDEHPDCFLNSARQWKGINLGTQPAPGLWPKLPRPKKHPPARSIRPIGPTRSSQLQPIETVEP